MRSELDIKLKNDEISRTLYIKLKKNIEGEKDIAEFVSDYERIILRRKKSRNCFVVFKTKDDQQKYLDKLKPINNIYVAPRLPLDIEKIEKTKPNKRKIEVKTVDEVPVKKILMVSNIPCETKAAELKEAFPGCYSLAIFKGNNHHPKQAKLKMESEDIVMDYLSKIRETPIIIRGQKLKITTPDKLLKKKRVKRLKRKQLRNKLST